METWSTTTPVEEKLTKKKKKLKIFIVLLFWLCITSSSSSSSKHCSNYVEIDYINFFFSSPVYPGPNPQMDQTPPDLSLLLPGHLLFNLPFFLNGLTTCMHKLFFTGAFVGQHWTFRNHIKRASLNLSAIDAVSKCS